MVVDGLLVEGFVTLFGVDPSFLRAFEELPELGFAAPLVKPPVRSDVVGFVSLVVPVVGVVLVPDPAL
ncbi:hypothetical protein D3C71_2137290 [compost metagenome]